jgi:hypothetical protein
MTCSTFCRSATTTTVASAAAFALPISSRALLSVRFACCKLCRKTSSSGVGSGNGCYWTRPRNLRCSIISCRLSAAFSASSRLLDLKSVVTRFKQRNISATIVVDVKRFGHRIKWTRFSVHRSKLHAELQATLFFGGIFCFRKPIKVVETAGDSIGGKHRAVRYLLQGSEWHPGYGTA